MRQLYLLDSLSLATGRFISLKQGFKRDEAAGCQGSKTVTIFSAKKLCGNLIAHAIKLPHCIQDPTIAHVMKLLNYAAKNSDQTNPTHMDRHYNNELYIIIHISRALYIRRGLGHATWSPVRDLHGHRIY